MALIQSHHWKMWVNRLSRVNQNQTLSIWVSSRANINPSWRRRKNWRPYRSRSKWRTALSSLSWILVYVSVIMNIIVSSDWRKDVFTTTLVLGDRAAEQATVNAQRETQGWHRVRKGQARMHFQTIAWSYQKLLQEYKPFPKSKWCG